MSPVPQVDGRSHKSLPLQEVEAYTLDYIKKAHTVYKRDTTMIDQRCNTLGCVREGAACNTLFAETDT